MNGNIQKTTLLPVLLIGAAVTASLSGCGKQIEPVVFEIACPETLPATPLGCSTTHLLEWWEAYESEGGPIIPGSRFVVQAASTTGPELVVCVGTVALAGQANANRAIEEFQDEIRRTIGDAVAPVAHPESCRAPSTVTHTYISHELQVSISPTTTQVSSAVLVDCSGSSIHDSELCSIELVSRVYEVWVATSGGDGSFTVAVAGSSFENTQIILTFAPEPRPTPATQLLELERGRLLVAGLNLRADPDRIGSALIEGLSEVGRHIRDQDGEKHIFIFSDLRQAGAELSFHSRRLPSEEQWFEHIDEHGLLSHLNSVRVTACGVHRVGIGEQEEIDGRRITDIELLWNAGLERAGASVEIFASCSAVFSGGAP